MTTNKQVADYALKIAVLDALISDALSGRTAVVISNYNGQPSGRSAKSWKGRTVHIDKAFYSGFGSQPRITVWLREERVGGGSASLGLDELELVEEKRTQW